MKTIIKIFFIIFSIVVISSCGTKTNEENSIYFDKVSFEDLDKSISGEIIVNKNNQIDIKGKAIGPWFFEAVFDIELIDENNKSLSQWYVEAIGEWMTTDFVEFYGQISYNQSETEYGYLIFSKANPSGLEEFELEKRVKIKLK